MNSSEYPVAASSSRKNDQTERSSVPPFKRQPAFDKAKLESSSLFSDDDDDDFEVSRGENSSDTGKPPCLTTSER